VFVFASRTETQGLVLLEAMALGVPVVSTAVMGTIDIVSPQKGALQASEEVVDFATKTMCLLRDKDLRDSIGLDGREFAATWSAPATAARLADIYQGLRGQGQPADDARRIDSPTGEHSVRHPT
jgi:1,2-diacylglycerol 3-alpha-glucosyltransferase